MTRDTETHGAARTLICAVALPFGAGARSPIPVEPTVNSTIGPVVKNAWCALTPRATSPAVTTYGSSLSTST